VKLLLLLNTFIILTPLAWGASWWFSLKAIAQERTNWRNKMSLAALAIATITGWLWLPAAFYASSHLVVVDKWVSIAVLLCAVAIIVCFFGKPKLIIPIALTCLGTASFWVGSTVP